MRRCERSNFRSSYLSAIVGVEPVKMLRKTFETFRVRGKRFLAIPKNMNGEVAIMDDEGNNYGAWQESVHFSDKYRKGETGEIGRCFPQIGHCENLACQDSDWRCECGGEETWFDRTLQYNPENYESCMVYRCCKCNKEAK